MGKTIHRTVVDEGASTCIMSFASWKTIGSPPLSQSPNTLEAFDSRGSRLYGILKAFPILLEGNTVNLEVKVVDSNLNYNLILGRSLTNAMVCVVSTLFDILSFPHQGKFVTVNQLAFFSSNYSNRNIPYVWNTTTPMIKLDQVYPRLVSYGNFSTHTS